jgi:hypothetical protein
MILITNCHLYLLDKYDTAVVIKSVALWSTRNLQPWNRPWPQVRYKSRDLVVTKFPVGHQFRRTNSGDIKTHPVAQGHPPSHCIDTQWNTAQWARDEILFFNLTHDRKLSCDIKKMAVESYHTGHVTYTTKERRLTTKNRPFSRQL